MRSAIACVLVLLAWAAFADRPSLGSAASFAVLGGTTVTSSGATRITGNAGVSPGDRVTGLANDALTAGEIHRDDALARSAQRDARAVAEALAPGECAAARFDAPLPPGIYCVTAPLERTVTLDGGPDALWIFRSASLSTTPGMSMMVKNGATSANVFWVVNGAVTLARDSQFVGNILASGDITLEAGAALYGRALARGAVTLDGNLVTLCCDPILLSGLTVDSAITTMGGTPPVTFTATELPPGWSLSPGGVLTRASEPSRVVFTVTATDAAGCTGSREYVLWSERMIPTLSEWLLVALAALLAAAGMRGLS